MGEPQQQHEGNGDCHSKEQRYADQTINQITHFLGKANDMDFDVGVLRLVLIADLLFQLVGELLIIQRDLLALIVRVGIGLQQRQVDDARLEVVSDQTANLPGLEDVAAQFFEAFGRAIVGLRNHFAAGKTFFSHFGPAYAWAPQ